MKFTFFENRYLDELKKIYNNTFNFEISSGFFANLFNKNFYFLGIDDFNQNNILIGVQTSIKTVGNGKKIILLHHMFVNSNVHSKAISLFMKQLASTLGSISSVLMINPHLTVMSDNITSKNNYKLVERTLINIGLKPILQQNFYNNLSIQLMNVEYANEVDITPEHLQKIYQDYCRNHSLVSERDINYYQKFIKYHAACNNIIFASDDCYGVYISTLNLINEVVFSGKENLTSMLLKLLGAVNERFLHQQNKNKRLLTYAFPSELSTNIKNKNEIQQLPGYFCTRSVKETSKNKNKYGFVDQF